MTKEIAPGVVWLGFNISGVYLVGTTPGEPWAVVDTGAPGHFEAIRAAAEEIHGAGAKPDAIILTHGHFDHYGCAAQLASFWNVPVYAHRWELPYLTGRECLPPLDPTVGGFFGFAARFLPVSGTDLGEYVHPLPDDGTAPGMPGWRWIHTPGHTPGHVSLFRDRDRTLLAGDALATVNLDDAVGTLTRRQEIAPPVTPAVSDWPAARRSLEALAALRPVVIGAGHGIPMAGPAIAEELEEFAADYWVPKYGRYVAEPARFDENGVVFLPPPAPDPLPKVVLGMAVAAAVVGLAVYFNSGRDRRRSEKT